ncbi:hypothetical protein MPDQ_006230 [Monascus purpureus]|uniref:Hypercellular protein HypA n=1 Tax=Monascus purpureus TaxID=5098 RepID=A0A507QYD8_MONPU|nr:hypothetical protein MPDQ_006230 [Monascus purpureus]
MDVDPLSPIAPARVRALLLPVGKIRKSRFLGFAARLQAENIIRLGDISPDARPNRNMFSPLAFPTGMILFDLSFSVPPISHLDLFPFEIFREPLVIIAIADGAELSQSPGETFRGTESNKEHGNVKVPTPDGLDELLKELDMAREKNSRALVHQLLIFDFDGLDNLVSGPDDVSWIPRPEASRATTMKTVLCDITSLLLSELDEFAKTLQTLPSIESPKALSWGPHRGPEIRPRPVDKMAHRMTMPTHLPSSPNGISETSLSSEQSTPTSRDYDTPTTFDEITRSIQLANRSLINKTSSISSPKEHSRDRMSTSNMSASDRVKNRIKGRRGVVIGSLYLKVGRWPDALKELVEAAATARAGSDYVWYAKALELILLCLIMFGWAGMDFQIPPICYPIADKSSKSSIGNFDPSSVPGNRIVSLQNLANLLPDLSNNILHLYNRAANITDEPVPQLAYSETVIRLARLLVVVRTRDGTLDDNALRSIVMNEPLVPLQQPERHRGTVILRKSDIVNFLFRAFPPQNSNLPATDFVPIVVGVASVLSALDLPRKKALVLKGLLSTMVPTLVQARKIGAAEAGIHPAAGLVSLSDTAFDINALDIGPGNMEESIRSVLAAIGEVYGVQRSEFYDLEKSDEDQRHSAYDSVSAIIERAARHSVLNGYGDLNLKIDVLRTCINCCEALPDFEGVLRFTVELLQTIRGDLMLTETYRVPPCLPPDEQVRLLNNIKRTVGAAQRLGLPDLSAEYWDDFLVRGVQLLPLPGSRRPVRQSKADPGAIINHEKSTKDPFLYNPFSKPSSKLTELLMVTGEHASFKVTLQNPYEFDLEIESLRLHSEGAPIDARMEGILLPPLSLQEIIVSGVAHTEGVLNITGCIVKIRHCRERKFPIFTTSWRPEPEIKLKRTGLSAKIPLIQRHLSWSSSGSKEGKVFSKKGPETSPCEVKVIRRQPSLVIETMSLSQSAMMVLEGETRSFKITLRNISDCPLDFIHFTFRDSTARQIESALTNKDLLPEEVYELQLKLLTRPGLRWQRDDSSTGNISIPAGQCATYTVDVFGKPGLQDAVVQIDYASIGLSSSELPDVFYTRQLFVPLTITVNASIEVMRCDILPFSEDFAWWNSLEDDPKLETNKDEIVQSLVKSYPIINSNVDNSRFSSVLSLLRRSPHGHDHCIALLDLRNAWPSPISVSLNISEQPIISSTEILPSQCVDGEYKVDGELQPGQISRFVLVLPRIHLDNPRAPIPLLNTGFKRQFVVSANKQTFEAEAASREAFWYSEELLKRIFGTWSETLGGRKGVIDLRNIRLNSRMVDAIHLEDVNVSFSVAPLEVDAAAQESNAVVQTGCSKYNVKTDKLLKLVVIVRNRSSKPIHPLLRLQPSLRNQPSNIALDLSRRLAWTGMLQRVLPVLHEGESAQATLGVTVLCKGEYEFGASIEEVRVLEKSSSAKDGGLDKTAHTSVVYDNEGPIKDTFGAGVVRRRRIWHSREACIMNAHD